MMNTSSPDTEQTERLHNGLQWEMPSVFKQDHQESTPYPVEALPSIIRDAVCSYQKYAQQPLPLIACSALANVVRDKYLVSSVSLYFLACLGSGV